MSSPSLESALDLTGASISTEPTEDGVIHPAPSIALPNQDAQCVGHIALDIGGSLIKLVYFTSDSPDNGDPAQDPVTPQSPSSGSAATSSAFTSSIIQHRRIGRGGRLHFVKFETSRMEDCIDFIRAKGLHRVPHGPPGATMRVKATGGGAYRYADLFRDRLGVVLEKEDEMGCLVAGCNFLLRAITHEVFTFENNSTQFVPTKDEADVYPYLLVNIGSGVSMVRVTGQDQFERVSGSSLGGGTFWGLCRLLTGLQDFDDMLELSSTGDNSRVDMLVGDIYGGRDYSSIGLSATTIASSFGKVISQDKSLMDYESADISMALCRMVSYNIGQLAYLNAMRYGIKRILFGGFFIRGHPYTMETISYAIRFWSKGEMAAMFLRHEGFLGAVGAFLLVNPSMSCSDLPQGAATADAASNTSATATQSTTTATKVRARFTEVFSTGAPLTGGNVVGPAIDTLQSKVNWVEKFVALGGGLKTQPSGEVALPTLQQQKQQQQQGAKHGSPAAPHTRPVGGLRTALAGHRNSSDLDRQLHADAVRRAASVPEAELAAASASRHKAGQGADQGVLAHQQHVDASSSSAPAAPSPPGSAHSLSVSRTWTISGTGGAGGGGGSGPARMALHVGVLHFQPDYELFPLLLDPGSYEANTIPPSDPEMTWWVQLIADQVPKTVKKAASSQGNTDEAQRRAAAFGSALGAHLEKLLSEPGAYGALGLAELFELREECLREFGFQDVYQCDKARENSASLQVFQDLLVDIDCHAVGPDRWLALIEGALAANIFDWGSNACWELYQSGTILDIYREARARLSKRPWALDNFNDIVDSLERRRVSGETCRVMMFLDNAGADVILGQLPLAREFLRLGWEVVLVANLQPAINDMTAAELEQVVAEAATRCSIIAAARSRAKQEQAAYGRVPPFKATRMDTTCSSSSGDDASNTVGMRGTAKLFVLDNGQGGPCINLRRVPAALAEACSGVGLCILEGMGRAVHTNLNARFKCDSLLLAMIKTERLAKHLFGSSGRLYDCICKASH